MRITRLFGLFLAGLLCAAPAAAQTKQVVVYTSNEDTLNRLVFGAFEQKTGIKVQPVSAGSGVVIKRVQTEKDRPQGDVIWGVSRSLLETNKQYFEPYKSKNHDAIPAGYRAADNAWTGNNLHILVILQNTKLLPADQGPKSWADLADPKWKGKIAFTDPANSGSAYSTVTLMASLFGGGDAGWKKVEQVFANMKILNRSSLVFQGVGNGEYPLGVSLEYAGYLWASNGAPVKVVYPSDGTVAQMEGCAVIKGGPNTEAARAFVDFVNQKDTRELILSKTFRRPARQDVDLTKLPGGMPALSAIRQGKYDEEAWSKARPETMQKIQDIIAKTR
ncbi:MAG: ABC transporter substrate-binding protein [Alphaproteobacteria bacterium]|nr:ABC transporter substrate-binding protein [Alphaproteobacteria bacterium]